MYRIKKVLNHNSILAIDAESNKEYLIIGKGIGFGKKVAERIEKRPSDKVYSLQEHTERGDATELSKSIPPIYFEIADEILNIAELEFGKIDRYILFPMADHIAFAVKRIKNNEQISNPLTNDIRVLFHNEYKIAQNAEKILKDRLDITISPDEIGYIALHIHSAVLDEKVSQSMQMVYAVRTCISLVEKESGIKLDILSLSYNRLMNHIRYMIARIITGETLKINMNDYIEVKFPKAFSISKKICNQIEKDLKCTLTDVEIGYLAMHIERVFQDEKEA